MVALQPALWLALAGRDGADSAGFRLEMTSGAGFQEERGKRVERRPEVRQHQFLGVRGACEFARLARRQVDRRADVVVLVRRFGQQEIGARTDEGTYRREVAAIRAQIEAARSAPEPKVAHQTRTLNSLVDRWEDMSAAQRKAVSARMKKYWAKRRRATAKKG